jgi:hypothetical protein
VDPLVVEQHKDNQVLFILAYSLFMIEVRYGTVRYGTVRYGTVRYGSELITYLSPSHPPDHEVRTPAFNYSIQTCIKSIVYVII